MKKGRISENVLKRSVLKYIHNENEAVLKGAGIGADCAFLEWKSSKLAISAQTVTLPIRDAAKYAVYAAANNLAAGGMQIVAAAIAITLPTAAEEARLKELMKQAEEACQALSVSIVGGHTEVTDSVKQPIVTVTGFGRPMDESVVTQVSQNVSPGFSIIMTKWIGLEGTAILAKEKEAELLTRYPRSLIRQAQGFDKYLPILPEAATALVSGVCTMHDVRSGGVFGALFELSRGTGVGLSVDLKQIPVKQETIEICEFFDLNPYELMSGGSLLLVTDKAEALMEALQKADIPAVIIGETIDSNDKLVINGEESRFLEPAGPDELFKINFAAAYEA